MENVTSLLVLPISAIQKKPVQVRQTGLRWLARSEKRRKE
jgi:hypothetical protein